MAAACRCADCHPAAAARQLGGDHVHIAAAALRQRLGLAGPQVLQQLQQQKQAKASAEAVAVVIGHSRCQRQS